MARRAIEQLMTVGSTPPEATDKDREFSVTVSRSVSWLCQLCNPSLRFKPESLPGQLREHSSEMLESFG